MAPPTVAQNASRMDKLEEELSALKASTAEEISVVIKKAATEMESSLTSQITTSIWTQ